MAQQAIDLDREKLSCSICLDLLKDPVTIPCGHNYCMGCIKNYWDEGDGKKVRSCPQCRQDFPTRPVLVKNTMLAELVELLKKAGLPAAPPDHVYAGPEEVACDFCTGRKMKASKSCLVCMASYCEQHLQPHYTVAPLKKHNLIKATSKLQENVCARHDEVMKIYCRTDQRCICYLCAMDEHKDHVTVSAAAERTERQKELGANRHKIQQTVQDREKCVKALEQRVEAIRVSGDKAEKDSEDILRDFVCLVEEKMSEVKQRIRSLQKTEESRVKEVQKMMQQEITELKRKDAELEQLSLTEDHLHFLNSYPSLSGPSESTRIPCISLQSQQYFEDLTAAVSKISDKLHATLSEEWANSSLKTTDVDIQDPKTRGGFLKYFRQITLDPATANPFLCLSMNNRKATLMAVEQSARIHAEKFLTWWQVLSAEGLTGRCYWEVKWSGKVSIAVAYKGINRTGSREASGFGKNDKSWALECHGGSYKFIHNNIPTSIIGPRSSRVGVYLDHEAGALSFYSITGTMNLLHKVKTKFTQPLYPGFWLLQHVGDTIELCEKTRQD